MNHLRLALVVTALAGCSAPVPQSTSPAFTVIHSQPYAMQEPGAGLKAPQFCHLGSDCLELDSRPFTPCLVNGESCEGEGGFMRAAPNVGFESIEPADIGPLPEAPPQK